MPGHASETSKRNWRLDATSITNLHRVIREIRYNGQGLYRVRTPQCIISYLYNPIECSWKWAGKIFINIIKRERSQICEYSATINFCSQTHKLARKLPTEIKANQNWIAHQSFNFNIRKHEGKDNGDRSHNLWDVYT